MGNSEELNRYYKLVNEYIDEYVEKWKINPKRLDKYFKNNTRLISFLERNGLDGINRIEKVINDVIGDRKSMAEDGVLTFEGFSVLESDSYRVQKIQECLYRGIDKATVEHEKIIADHYDTSLGHVDIKNSEKHHFSVNGNKYDTKVVIYTKDELEKVKSNLIDYSYTKLVNETMEVMDIGIKIEVKDFIDEEKFNQVLEKQLSATKVSEAVCGILSVDKEKHTLTSNGHLIVEYDWGGKSEH